MNFNQSAPDHIKGLQERQTSFSQLEKLGNLWIGPDLALEKPLIVNPGEFIRGVNIIVNKRNLPDIEINRGALRSLGLSIRSFYAQTGIDINFHSSELSNEMLKDINDGKDTLIPIDITNHGQRPVEVSGSVMRFFWANDRKRLRGIDLVNKIKSGEFVVEGTEGEDWYLGGNNENDKFTTKDERAKEALCVVVRLKPERFYIPSDTEPVRKDNKLGTRDNLATFLKPIPPGEKVDFEIGETPKMVFGQNVVGVINLGWSDQGEKHINSPLIDPGFNQSIRTETLNGPSYVEFFLYEK